MHTNTLIERKLLRTSAIAMIAVAILALALVALPSRALADDSSSSASASDSASAASAGSSDSASAASAGSSSSASAASAKDAGSLPVFGGLPLMGNDYVWLGRSLELGGHEFANDVLAAGESVTISSGKVAGSIRAAARDITISNTTVAENITVAAEHVAIQDSKANAVVATGRTVSVSGSHKELTVYAEDVFIDGEVEGDLNVGANNVEVGANARIKGTLHVNAPKEPVMQNGSKVNEVKFTKTESEGSAGGFGSVNISEFKNAMSELTSMLMIILAIATIIGTVIIAVLAEWLFRRHTAAAADMIRTRTGATIGTGVVGALVAPLAVILLFCLVVTFPVAAGLTCALLAITFVACGFAGASLFKLVFPRLGRYKCALAGGAIVGVASIIPILGPIVDAAAFMYLLGYILQSIYLGLRAQKLAASGAPIASSAPIASDAPVSPITSAAPIASDIPAAPVDSPAPVAPTSPTTPEM